MYNLLLDSLPSSFEGYLIRSDYRIGIQISQILEDEEFSDWERIKGAISLLFGKGIPDTETAMKGLRWFLNGGLLEEPEQTDTGAAASDNGIRYFSFDADAGRIYSGFRKAYGIELDCISMHWFKFLSLLADLGECAFTQVIDYRTADISKMDKETKKVYLAMRRKFSLPQPESEEAKEFMSLLGEQI